MSAVALAAAPRGLWYLTRGLGAVTFVLLTLTIVLGVADVKRFALRPKLPRFLVDGLHRNVSLLVLVLLTLHVLTSVVDKFAPINLVDGVIPFVSSYRPLWLGLGAIALDLLVAVAVTSMLRARLGFRAWRAVHWLAYACWPVALAHAFGAGSDARQGWMLVLSGVCVVAVLVAIAWRAGTGWPASRGIKATALAASVAGAVALVVWLETGPLAPGWARRAGTPPAVLAAVGTGSTAVTPAGGLPHAPFSAHLDGTVSERAGEASTVVSIRTALSRGGRLNVTLAGPPLADGGVSMRSSEVTLGTAAEPRLYSGRITALAGTRFEAKVSNAVGNSMRLRIDLAVDGSGSATGTLDALGGGAE